MATRSKLAALGRQLRASAPLVGAVPQLSGAPAAALPAMSFAAVDTVERLDPFGARHASRQIVKQRMKSVGNIAKITKAMKMVAASRLRGVQIRMEQSRGLPLPMVKLLGDTPGVAAEKTLVVPITSDKGLCGGINSTVVKYTKVINGVCADSESEASLYVFGEKGRAQLARGATQKQLVGVLVDVAKPKEGITFASASLVADSLLGTGFEKMHLIYNRFQSVISFKPTVATLLSSSALEASGEAAGGLPFDQYEAEGPDRSEFLLDLSEFHLAATLYNALLENSTSELGSRMQSMENSTKNAQEMLSKLTLFYNRTRQAAITTELIEIISGAAALEG